jgi:hypothetical protein
MEERVAVKYSFEGCVAALKGLSEAAKGFEIANQREPTMEELIGYEFRGKWLPQIAMAVAAAAGEVIYGDPKDPRRHMAPQSVSIVTSWGSRPVVYYKNLIDQFFENTPFFADDFRYEQKGVGSPGHFSFTLGWKF